MTGDAAGTGDDEGAVVEIDPAVFRNVLGHYPTGVTVVAAEAAGRPVGLTVGSFFSVSLDPPLVGFCVAETSSTWQVIAEHGAFGVSVLADDQHETSGRFASRIEDKFEGISWERAPVTGSPLIHQAVAHLDCEIHDVFPAGDHAVVIGRVLALEVHRSEVGALVFARGGYHRHESLD
jgi:3-hydroxy-9,10-secoandrosta-1,3,5(10)-triene-9,17-dione monooxygenase reductase component